MRYIKYILIIIVLVGFFNPIIKVYARPLTADEQTLINSARATLNITQSQYDELRMKPPGDLTADEQRQLNSLKLQRDAATAEINLVNTAAGTTSPQITCVYKDSVGTSHPVYNVTDLECTQMGGTLTSAPPAQTIGYTLLAPLPNPDNPSGELKTNIDTTKGLGDYLNLMIKIVIGLAAVLSVVMIVIGGIEVMTSELVHSKEAGKERIEGALLGLVIALGAYALLFTINPDLLKSDIDKNIPNTTPTPQTSTPPTVQNWYFVYKPSNESPENRKIGGPFPSEQDCAIAGSTQIITRFCFQSNTPPDIGNTQTDINPNTGEPSGFGLPQE